MNETATPDVVSLLERQPHMATRAVVEALGSDAPKALYRAFDTFNAEHFAGALGAPLLFITQTSGPRALGDYIGRDVHGLRSRMRIAPGVMARGERFALDVLLHEMVHAWQSEVDRDREDGYRGHGPRFAAKCNEIGQKLGLSPVGVKKRKGLPDCAQWPLCVRPAGYYPTAAPAASGASSDGSSRARGGAGDKGGGVVALRGAVAKAVALAEKMTEPQRHASGFDAWLAEVSGILT